MKMLEEKIRTCGRALNEDVLLVDMFLNNQVDCKLMDAIGDEFCRLFKDAGITRVMTIEASGIAPSVTTALKLNVPLVIMKKQASAIMNGNLLTTEVFSFTKQKSYTLSCKPEYIKKGDRVLFIDDFLANGEAAFGASRLIEQAGAAVSGIGVVISKNFQPGFDKLCAAGYHVESLAMVKEMGEGYVKFVGED